MEAGMIDEHRQPEARDGGSVRDGGDGREGGIEYDEKRFCDARWYRTHTLAMGRAEEYVRCRGVVRLV
jgi:hypothetical protein